MDSSRKLEMQEYCLHVLKMFGVVLSDNKNAPFRKYSWRVPATAIFFFWRYFEAQNDTPSEDFTLVMLASLYLAGKLEGSFLKSQSLLDLVGNIYTDKQLNDMERRLIEILSFDIHVEHAQCVVRSLLGKEWIKYATDKLPENLVGELLVWTNDIVERSLYLSFFIQAAGICVDIDALTAGLSSIAFSIASNDNNIDDVGILESYLCEKVGKFVVEHAKTKGIQMQHAVTEIFFSQ